MQKVVISNSLGRLENGRQLILFPSRWTAAVETKSRPFSFYPYELAYLSTLLKRELPSADSGTRTAGMQAAHLRRAVPWIGLVLAVALWLHAHRTLEWTIWAGDEFEYADVARHLARGDGFTTGIIYPAELSTRSLSSRFAHGATS